MRQSTRPPRTRHTAAPVLRAQVLGQPLLQFNGQTIELPNRKSFALLCYLLLVENGREARKRLVGLLWSDKDEVRAQASLRQALYEVRQACERVGFDGFESNRFEAGLKAGSFDVDLSGVLEKVRSGRSHRLLLDGERMTDRLLAGCDDIDPAFDVWLAAKREAVSQRLLRDLEVALRVTPATEPESERLARSILNLDPTNEEAARATMTARYAAGDTAGALAVYKRLWELLDVDYDTEPSEDTQRLVAAIKLGRGITPAKPPTITKEPPASLVKGRVAGGAGPADVSINVRFVLSVAPFDLGGARADQSHLVHGFRRELLACLARFREWQVRDMGPRNSHTVDQAAGEYVIEASTIQAASKLRLVLTLKEAATGVLLWSERLELSAAEWQSAQQMVVRHLAAALEVNVSAERLSSIAARPDAGLQVFDTWLRGQALILSFDPADWHRAAELFRAVIREAPGFAPAYSSLAQIQNTIHFVHPGIFRSRERTADALTFAREATRLDPIDSRAHLALGWAYAFADQHEQALAHHEIAHELNDNDPWTSTSASLGFAFGGEIEKAKAFVREADRQIVSPMPIHWRYRAIVEHIGEDYAASLAAAEQASSPVPNELGWKVSALQHLGETSRARDELQRFYTMVSRRWCGSEAATERNMVRWFLHLFPIRRKSDWEHLRAGLAGAGAPVTDLTQTSAHPAALA